MHDAVMQLANVADVLEASRNDLGFPSGANRNSSLVGSPPLMHFTYGHDNTGGIRPRAH